jgi:hypothetical protein
MSPHLNGINVIANCPTCKAVTTYEASSSLELREFGTVRRAIPHRFRDRQSAGFIYSLLRCAGCGSGGLAEIHMFPDGNAVPDGLERFFPNTIEKHPVPKGVPEEIKNEFEEAELCASVAAWRSASAMLRSVLEKTLKLNGYDKGSLKDKIDEAVKDGILTEARSRRAHENIRVLGNDILHDAWRAVTTAEFDDAHMYAQRILEDFYDDRPTVEGLLTSKGRLPSATPP